MMLEEPFPATINDPDSVGVIDTIARENFLKVHKLDSPFRWSEDFGHFLKKYKGAFFGIGSGTKHPGLHTHNYDFPDEILETAVKMFSKISEHFLY
jgi:metal-dependent amidase/aminoacylase/carboxypeptidase family protein